MEEFAGAPDGEEEEEQRHLCKWPKQFYRTEKIKILSLLSSPPTFSLFPSSPRSPLAVGHMSALI